MFPDPLPGLLPFQTVNLFGGAPGAGKTTLLADWLAAWQHGQPICGVPSHRPTEVCYLAADRSWSRYQPVLTRAGATAVRGYSLVDDPSIAALDLDRADRATHLLHQLVARLAPAPGSLLVIEPLSPLFIAGSPNDARAVATSLVRLRRLAVQYQLTVLATLHFAKQRNDPATRYTRPQDRFAGSTSFAGFADSTIFLLEPEPPDVETYTLGWVSRDLPPRQLALVRDTDGRFRLASAVGSTAADALHSLLPLDPLDRASLLLTAAPLRLSISTLKRALATLVAEGRVSQPRRGFYQRVEPS